MKEIAQIRGLSLWIFFIPLVAINLCLFISINYDLFENTLLSVDQIGKTNFSDLISNIRQMESATGKINYNVTSSAKKHLVGKRSIYTSAKIKKGDLFTKNNIKVVRPFHGLDPKYYNYILGKKSSCNLSPATRIKLAYIKK